MFLRTSLAAFAALVALLAAGVGVAAAATPSFTPTISPTPTISATYTLTPTISATSTATPTISATYTASPTPTISATYTASPTITISPTPSVTATPTPTVAPQLTLNRNKFNPSRGETLTIKGIGPHHGDVEIKVYTVMGTLLREWTQPADQWQTPPVWDGRNADNEVVASGVYVIMLRGDRLQKRLRIAVLK